MATLLQTNNVPASINNKYIPPNKKQAKLTPRTEFKSSLTEENALKKGFSLQESLEAFPSLSSAYKGDNSQHMKSFANATQTEIIKPQKKISDVKPGWIHIRKYNREIQFKYGPPSDRNPFPCEISDIRFGEMLVKHRLAKEQYDRDCDVERLGDLSEYYGEPTIQELFEEEERLMMKSTDSGDSDNDTDSNYDIYMK